MADEKVEVENVEVQPNVTVIEQFFQRMVLQSFPLPS